MKKYDFLILGKNQPILEILLRLVNANENWNAVGFHDEELAKDHFLQHNVDFVLLSSAIEDHVEKEFAAFCLKAHPGVEIIEHFGGGSGLLKSEILHRLHLKGKI
jgi:hypothetical protein